MNGKSAAHALAALLALAAGAAQAAAGKVLFVAGPVTVERPAPAPLKQGDAIDVGDVIVTGEKARAQLLMNDGARIALRAGTRYRVDAFNLPSAVDAPTQAGTAAAEGVSVATVLKGGFRASTGAIGKDGKGNYEVRAPIGTLGIRGTEYTAVWCQGDCPASDGLYLTVHEGAVVLRHGGRESPLAAGRSLRLAAAGAEPESLETAPSWMLEDEAGPLTTGAQAGPGGSLAPLDLADRRDPPPGGEQSPGAAPPDPEDPEGADVSRPITGTLGGQAPIDLTPGTVPRGSQDPLPPGQQPPGGPPSTHGPPPNQPPPPPPGGP